MNTTDIILPPKSDVTEGEVSIDMATGGYRDEAMNKMLEAGTDPELQLKAIYEICLDLVRTKNKLRANMLIDELCKDFKIKKSLFNAGMQEAKQMLAQESMDEDNADATPLINRVEKYIAERYDIFFNIIANKFMYRKVDDDDFVELNIDNIYRELKKHHLSFSQSDLKSLLKSDFTKKSKCLY